MELKQTKTIMDVRRGYLLGVLASSIVAVLITGIIVNFTIIKYGIPVFTIIIFAIFTIVLSIFYDIYINSTYRIFLQEDNIYIYYPTYSSRAGNEFIFYRIEDISYAMTKGSSIVFDGHVLVKTEGVEREELQQVDNVGEVFEKIFEKESYKIHKRFRVSRIFDNERELMEALEAKKKNL
ncbi:hypothetical protein ACTQ6A_14355 [Lachnospiraceae bacterium LCP25S3_G4]